MRFYPFVVWGAVLILCPPVADAGQLPPLPGKKVWPSEALPAEKGLARVVRIIPRLSYPRGDRWPLLVWHQGLRTAEELQRWIDRGMEPMYRGWINRKNMPWILPRLKQLQEQQVPLILMAQSLVQVMFLPPKKGKKWPPGCDHLPPARPERVNRDFACPAWMVENPYLKRHAEGFRQTCGLYKNEGIHPAAILIDFESGVYLRNSAESQARVQKAMEESWICPRCLKRFGKAAMDTLEEYQSIADAARAWPAKICLTDPVAAVFPGCKTGNFYAWPANRAPRQPGLFPAYGYEGSGMNVPQPRQYFTAGWAGCGREESKADWNTLLLSLKAYSPCAKVLREGETLVPWIGIVRSRNDVRERRKKGQAYATPEGFAEVVRHSLLRGAETLAVFNLWSDPAADFPETFGNIPRKEVGPWIMIMQGIQRGYDDMLRFNHILRQGHPLNYEITGEPNRLDETATVWSGVATDQGALLRTITFGPEGQRTLELFKMRIQVPFQKKGQFLWVSREGEITPLK